jgi:hypothetical protein
MGSAESLVGATLFEARVEAEGFDESTPAESLSLLGRAGALPTFVAICESEEDFTEPVGCDGDAESGID